MLFYERSLELLQLAAGAGGVDPAALRTDERFDAVRSDPAFEELLRSLERG